MKNFILKIQKKKKNINLNIFTLLADYFKINCLLIHKLQMYVLNSIVQLKYILLIY